MERWHKELKQAFLWVALASLLSLYTGHFSELLLAVTLGLFYQHLRQINRFERWLSCGAPGHPDQSNGIWGDIYYYLYKIKKNEKQRKKKLSKMVEQFRKSTDALPDAAVVLGTHGEIQWSNKAAREVLGLKKTDKGQRIPNLIRSPQFTHYLKSQDYQQKISIPSPVDDNIILQISIVPYGAGLRLLSAQDITQLKNVERVRRDFVANVSHELRTPLTVLKGYLETLQSMDNGHSAIYTRSFEQMLAQTERMQWLVDDLLLLARLESKPKHAECVDVVDLLKQICRGGQLLKQQEERLVLSMNSPARLQGDPQELHSAFTNLIVNALKYSPADSQVQVFWRDYHEDDVCFEVIDHGEGIAHGDISRVTERFYRVEVKRDHKINGTGLGLAIVKHVLVRHHAKLEIESELGKGSCFRCVFPARVLCF